MPCILNWDMFMRHSGKTQKHVENVKQDKTLEHTIPYSYTIFAEESNVILATVCYYHVIFKFQSESALNSLPECQGIPCLKQAADLKFK